MARGGRTVGMEAVWAGAPEAGLREEYSQRWRVTNLMDP